MRASPFGNLVQEKIKTSSYSLREVCRKTGMDPSCFSKVLRGKRPPPDDEKLIRKLAKVLDLDPILLTISAGIIPSSLQDLMQDPETIRRVLGESGRRGTTEPKPKPVSKLPPHRLPVVTRSPELSEDLL